ncbi:hypothetical protein M3Y99_01194400 [Aphelenchoides fujianensis]|nr:hypothetical protein M3Y99_01194400 [Aphelenchoides fujianensis]
MPPKRQASLKAFFSSQPAANDENTPPSPRAARPPAAKRTPTRKRKIDETQTIIDAGQRKFGLEMCATCGMTFNANHEHDVKVHEEFHNRFSSTKPFHVRPQQMEAWKKNLKHETITAKAVQATIFQLHESTTSTLRRKVDEIVETNINPELGFCADVATWKDGRSALVLVVHADAAAKSPQMIAAVGLVDAIQSAVLQPDGRKLRGAFVGVNRVWVHESLRRRGLATLLLNVARRLVHPAVPLPKVLVAFDEPEAGGLEFAVAYTKQKDGKYLTYADC